MADQGYSWNNARNGSSYSLPKSENFGRWVGVAVVLAVIFHLLVFFGLKHMQIAVGSIGEMLDLETEQVRVAKVEFTESLPEMKEEKVETPEVRGDLLDEIEMLTELPEDTEVDIRPDIKEPEFSVKLEAPAEKGDEFAASLEPVLGQDLEVEMAEIGKMDDILQPAAAGQVLVDPGEQIADVYDPDKFNDEMKKGAGGLADKGAMDKFTPLGDMANMSGNALENATGMIGSDLLFEYNKSSLRESARNSLLKVALLIDKNPNLNCWIGGHTDLFGGDTFNKALSVKRAEAVKVWLVESMKIDPERLIVIGYGKEKPLVTDGDEVAQGMNRRVEIMMRKGMPGDTEPPQVAGRPAEVVVDEQKPVLIKPKGPPIFREPMPREKEEPSAPVGRAVPVSPGKAVPVEEDEEPGRAVPIEPKPPRAIPVE